MPHLFENFIGSTPPTERGGGGGREGAHYILFIISLVTISIYKKSGKKSVTSAGIVI